MAKAAPGRLFLLDSMNAIFRAFHQPQTQAFHTRDGLPTGCVLVFHNIVRKLLEEHRPEYLAAVFDTSAPTFRDELFVEYKANRAAMPEDLARQLPYIRRLLEALRIPIVEAPGFEADDVLATLALTGVNAGMEVTIVSGDKDMRQMVRPGVTILDPMKNTGLRHREGDRGDGGEAWALGLAVHRNQRERTRDSPNLRRWAVLPGRA